MIASYENYRENKNSQKKNENVAQVFLILSQNIISI